MGILLNQLENSEENKQNFKIIFLINELYQRYNQKEQLKQDQENLIEIKNKATIGIEKATDNQKVIIAEMKALIEQKETSYDIAQMEYRKSSNFARQMNSLIEKCSRNESQLLQYTKQASRISQKQSNLEDEKLLVSKKIEDVLNKITEEYKKIDINELNDADIVKQLCDDYFGNISDCTIKERLKVLLTKNYELEKRIVQYVYNISNRVLRIPSYKINEHFMENSMFCLSLNEKIYHLIFNFAELKNINKYKKIDMEYIIEIISNLINILTIYVNALVLGKMPKNEKVNFTLKNQGMLSGKITFKKYRLEFLHKKEVHFFQEQQKTFNDIIRSLRLYYDCDIENPTNVKSKIYYHK